MFDGRWIRYNLSDGYHDRVICNSAEMEGYYVEKTWSVFESHRETLFASATFVKKAAFRLYEISKTKLCKTRAVSDPPKRKSKKRTRHRVAETVGL